MYEYRVSTSLSDILDDLGEDILRLKSTFDHYLHISSSSSTARSNTSEEDGNEGLELFLARRALTKCLPSIKEEVFLSAANDLPSIQHPSSSSSFSFSSPHFYSTTKATGLVRLLIRVSLVTNLIKVT